jgi:hypothetical protein
MELLSGVWEKIIEVTATIIVALGFFTAPVPVTQEITPIIATSSAGILVLEEVQSTTTEINERAVPGEVDAKGFYQGPRTCRGDVKKNVDLQPTGNDGNYSKEDAIVIAKQHCFFDGRRETDISSWIVSLVDTKKTGEGQAWHFQEQDLRPVTRERCPDVRPGLTPTLAWEFELNETTGLLIITEECGGAIFD